MEERVKEYRELISMRAKLDEEIERVRKAERHTAIREIGKLIVEFGINATELREIISGVRRKKPQAKYWDPLTGATWSGRGRRPKWLSDSNRDAYRLPHEEQSGAKDTPEPKDSGEQESSSQHD
ncbi:H-NS family nucleoid-associated regulatory protein [Burkholderia ambifaria]|uniref:H-NS histone family protein n=1 Tax=Burkholderia ambifaria TaxID=152480 RepID=UPI00158D0933|nr:H-NS histone family protein [Burkholderia ambifaria]